MNEMGLDVILDRIMDGETLRVIAAELKCSRPLLSRWLLGYDKQVDETEEDAKKRRALYEQARRLSAMALAEDGLDKLDNERDPRAAQLANYRAQFRLKLAEVFDRERFGQPKQPIQVNIGTLHLDALRRRTLPASTPVLALPAGSEVEDAEVEVTDDE